MIIIQAKIERASADERGAPTWWRQSVRSAVGMATVASLWCVMLATSGSAVAAEKANSCGCYQDASGSCYCNKKAKCGCPGSCEPKGCEEKREKELQRQIEAETRKAQTAGRRSAADDKRAAVAQPRDEREPANQRKPKVVRMTPAQRKELVRLLDLYAAERGDRGGRTLDQVRNDLTASAP